MNKIIRDKGFHSEFNFSTSRSSGPGGQNVNKLNTKVELRFSVANSTFLSELEKHKILINLKNRINNENELIIVAQSERSQLRNKEEAIEKFYQLIEVTLKPRKKRRPTKPGKSAIEKRLNKKRILSEKKNLRKNPQ